MASEAGVTLVGNITNDPEAVVTKTGTPLTKFGIAVNRSKPDGSGGWIDEVSFFNVTSFNSVADNVKGCLNKGDRVVVVGRLQQDQWDDPTSGEKRSAVLVIADEIAASVKWATVSITKNPKKGSGIAAAKAALGANAVPGGDDPF